jgi:alkanesulfonate monooxygenase SsuD/methylene tetrahydromethanopterin reductase-like flavin-dependent oxidoreductase (luciferase family)
LGSSTIWSVDGANFICFSPIDKLPEMMGRYLSSSEQQREQKDPTWPHVDEPLYGGSMHLFLAETDAQAVERARVAYQVYGANFDKPVPAGAAPQPRPAGPRTIFNPGVADFDTVRQWDRLIVGSPQTVREYIERYVADSTCSYLVGSFQWGDLTHAEASHSLDLFATEVMPHFVDSPVQARANS